MKLRANKPLRHLGVYRLGDKTLILVKRSEELSFLFTQEHWDLHGPVDYRVSHGNIYSYGQPTGLTDEDLLDTGSNAKPPALSVLVKSKKR